MRAASEPAGRTRRSRRGERVILFFVSDQMFAIAADAVQEVRSTDSLAGATTEIEDPELPKVRQAIERGGHSFYVVNACEHFGLPAGRPALVLVMRKVRVAALVDRIERMAEIPGVYPLPASFAGDERRWYRGLAYVDDSVIPVIDPSGFLGSDEFLRLDRAAGAAIRQRDLEGAAQP